MPVEFQDHITRADLRNNRHKVYIFGDNDQRRGLGGQAAEMRGESNSLGVRTKSGPTYYPVDLWTDETYDTNITKIAEDLDTAYKLLRKGKTIVISSSGLGSGRAMLDINAPRTFQFIQDCIKIMSDLNPEVSDQ